MPDIYLHTDVDGSVWSLCPGGVPHTAATSVSDYSKQLPPPDGVRLLSCSNNDELQYELLCRGVRVSAVGNVFSCAAALRPFQLLLQLNECRLPASVGGWWSCGLLDLHNYRIRHDLMSVSEHPVISTLTELVNNHALLLVASAMDPRRFINPAKPTSSSRFKAFIRLRPRRFLVNRPHPFLRCIDGWDTLPLKEAIKQTDDFADFIWRKWLWAVQRYYDRNG